MNRFILLTGSLFIAACNVTIDDLPDRPADAATAVRADAGTQRPPEPTADAGPDITAPDATTSPPEPPPACRRDPFRSDGPNSFELADWLAHGSPCAYIEGLPAGAGPGDDTLYDDDRDGYLECRRDLPPGIYTIRIAAMDCRTHQFGDPAPYGGDVLQLVDAGDRDAFYCVAIPIINCLDWGNGNYTCWVQKTEFLCDLRIEVLEDGTIRGAGGMRGAYSIPQRCE